MSAPTPATRAVVYERDGHRCVSCGSTYMLEFQHRQAVGMGGSKRRPRSDEGLTSCHWCNAAYEGDMQDEALRCGWKVPRYVTDPAAVPVYYKRELAWYMLDRYGRRTIILAAKASRIMRAVYVGE